MSTQILSPATSPIMVGSIDGEAINLSPRSSLEVPNSGWRAWLVVLGAFCANAVTVGVMSSTGTIQDYLLQHDLSHESESNVGWIFSIYLFLMLLGGIQTGPFVDTLGIKFLILPGCLLWCASLMILSTCHEYYQFILGFSILGGLSSSLIYNPSYTVVSQYFTSKRSVAIGIAAIGSSVVGSFLPIALTAMFENLGYGWSIRIVGFVVVGLSLIICFTLRSRVVRPAQVRWRDIGIDWRCLKVRNYSWTVLAVSFQEWAYFVPSLYVVGYAKSVLDFSNQDSNLLLVYMNISSTVGRFGGAVVANYFGPYNTIICSSVLASVVSLGVWLPCGTTSAGMTAFAVCFGVSSGVGMSLGAACVASISTEYNFGKRYGTCFAIVSFAILTSYPIGGLLTARTYLGMKIITAIAYLVSASAFYIARLYTPKTSVYI